MRSISRNLHIGLAVLFVAALVVQVFLAGIGVFDRSGSFATHRDVGYMLSLIPILLAILGVLGGLGRTLAGLAALEFVLVILQSVFVAQRETNPAIAALHPVNGFLILLLAIVIVRGAWQARTEVAAIA